MHLSCWFGSHLRCTSLPIHFRISGCSSTDDAVVTYLFQSIDDFGENIRKVAILHLKFSLISTFSVNFMDCRRSCCISRGNQEREVVRSIFYHPWRCRLKSINGNEIKSKCPTWCSIRRSQFFRRPPEQQQLHRRWLVLRDNNSIYVLDYAFRWKD